MALLVAISVSRRNRARIPGTLSGMKRLRTFLERLTGGHRPPTGPLTTAETADAEELRQEALAKDAERIDEEKEAGDREL